MLRLFGRGAVGTIAGAGATLRGWGLAYGGGSGVVRNGVGAVGLRRLNGVHAAWGRKMGFGSLAESSTTTGVKGTNGHGVELGQEERPILRRGQLLIPTTREDPVDAVTQSHRLLIRAGLIRRVG